MKVVITGGTGFIGQRLARRIGELGVLTGPSGEPETVEEIVLFDHHRPAAPIEAPGLRVVQGDIAQREQVSQLIDRDDVSVFHLASVVSGAGEQDFDLALRVNLKGGRNLLEACRARQGAPRLVFASSIAVFGGSAMPAAVGDTTKQTPQTTYGTTKAILELLINDYSRKGFLDGRSARLPTIIIRPGKPNAAASSFASGLFREPLNGIDWTLPVAPETAMPVLGYRAAVANLIKLHELPGEALDDDRAVGLPSLPVTVGDMLAALPRAAGPRRLGTINIEPDPFIERICAGWPRQTEDGRAGALGLASEASLEEIVAAYIEDYLVEAKEETPA
jgi:nucleoside-diphosphate-sugar epimerase